MTTPPPGAPDPNAPQYQPGSYPPPAAPPPPAGAYPPAPQPGYGQPAYGQPPYGQPAYPQALAKRPGVLTAAAVLGFVSGGLSVIGNLTNFGLYSLWSGFLVFLGILSLVVGLGMLYGAYLAITDKDTRILTAAAAGAVVLNLISFIWLMSLVGSFAAMSLLSFVIPVLIIVFCMNPQSKAWIKSKGGTTF